MNNRRNILSLAALAPFSLFWKKPENPQPTNDPQSTEPQKQPEIVGWIVDYSYCGMKTKNFYDNEILHTYVNPKIFSNPERSEALTPCPNR